jgi:hypothetical protein
VLGGAFRIGFCLITGSKLIYLESVIIENDFKDSKKSVLNQSLETFILKKPAQKLFLLFMI